MNALALAFIWVGSTALAVLVIYLVSAWLDGYEERRDSRRRNGAHRR